VAWPAPQGRDKGLDRALGCCRRHAQRVAAQRSDEAAWLFRRAAAI
jgi:hypothetical protein